VVYRLKKEHDGTKRHMMMMVVKGF